jgi:hypothetical protein
MSVELSNHHHQYLVQIIMMIIDRSIDQSVAIRCAYHTALAATHVPEKENKKKRNVAAYSSIP